MLFRFVKDCVVGALQGDRRFWAWMSLLLFFISMGFFTFLHQYQFGLAVTGMSDQVSWGFYVSNFTYLVGVAAAAVMLVIPAYIFKHHGAKEVVILGEALAVAASAMCIMFVMVDLGQATRFWHMMPVVGLFNWPSSLLTWDVIVLNGYLALNILIPGIILYHKYIGKECNKKILFSLVLLAIFWAFSLHVVTAFLFASNMSRPFWNSALTAPRFLASAFTAGPAAIIVVFLLLKRFHIFKIENSAINLLSVITAVALQINLIMLASEFFIEFYNAPSHSASAHYLFFGIDGHNKLVPWIWSSIALNLVAVFLLLVKRFRYNHKTLFAACLMTMTGVWIEKGMGFVVTGFIPTPIGELVEYSPTWIEIQITLGIYATGLLILTLFLKGILVVQAKVAEGKHL